MDYWSSNDGHPKKEEPKLVQQSFPVVDLALLISNDTIAEHDVDETDDGWEAKNKV